MDSFFGNLTDALFPVGIFSSNSPLASSASEPFDISGKRNFAIDSIEDISEIPDSDIESSSDDEHDYDGSDIDSETELDRAANEIVMNGADIEDDLHSTMTTIGSVERSRRQRTQSLPIAAVETVYSGGSQKRASAGGESASSAKKAKQAAGNADGKKQATAAAPEKKSRKTQMDKRELKKLKNREAAARCRNRRKQLIDDLSSETNQLKKEMAKMQDQIDKLKGENRSLQHKLQANKTTCSSCHRNNAAARPENQLNQYLAVNQLQYGSAVDLLGTQSNDQLDYLLGSNLKLPFYQATEELGSFVPI